MLRRLLTIEASNETERSKSGRGCSHRGNFARTFPCSLHELHSTLPLPISSFHLRHARSILALRTTILIPLFLESSPGEKRTRCGLPRKSKNIIKNVRCASGNSCHGTAPSKQPRDFYRDVTPKFLANAAIVQPWPAHVSPIFCEPGAR